jgi:DNA-binding NtrC family response regulator
MELQAKLLRVLENGEYQRIGETLTRKSRARIVAATNRDLRAEVRAGKFRSDLYHRLSVFAVKVPPLRDLKDDKHLLREHFIALYTEQIGHQAFKLDRDAEARWGDYHFPGNVRELRNIVIRLIAKYAGKTVSEAELIQEFDLNAAQTDQDGVDLTNESTMATQAQRHLQQKANVSLDAVLKTWEKAYIDAALKITHGNLSQAAKLLNVNRTTLYSRMNTQEEI